MLPKVIGGKQLVAQPRRKHSEVDNSAGVVMSAYRSADVPPSSPNEHLNTSDLCGSSEGGRTHSCASGRCNETDTGQAWGRARLSISATTSSASRMRLSSRSLPRTRSHVLSKQHQGFLGILFCIWKARRITTRRDASSLPSHWS